MPAPPPGLVARAQLRRTSGGRRRRKNGSVLLKIGAVLLADAERLDDAAVTPDVLRLEVVEETPPLADHHEQSPARVVILQVHLEVLGQIRDALGQERDLHLWGARVAGLTLELLDDLCLTFRCKSHCLIFPVLFPVFEVRDSPRKSHARQPSW